MNVRFGNFIFSDKMFLDELNPVKVFRQFVGTLFRAFPAN